MALINNGLVSGTINGSGELVLTKQGGSSLNLGNIKDHGGLTGLGDDDHTQYALADGSRGDFATTAQGTKADDARPHTQAEVEFDGDGATSFVEEFTVNDDSTSTSGWVNRLRAYFRPPGASDSLRRLVFFLNEYFELRLIPAKYNTVPLRLFVRDNSTVQSTARDNDVPMVQIMDDRTNRNPIFGIYPQGDIRVGDTEILMSHVLVLGPVEAVPSGTPANTVIVRTT
jgi:hypothetical protein